MEVARWEDGQLVLLVAVGVEGKAPSLLVAKVAQATQMRGRVAQPFQVLLPALGPVGWRPAGHLLWLGVGVNVAELPPEANLQAGVLPGKVLLGVAPNARLGPALYALRNLDPT